MYHSNVIEENLGTVALGEDSRYRVTVKPFEIYTVGIVPRLQGGAGDV